MNYATFITRLRAESKDFAKPMHNDFTGDGGTTLFLATDAPILEGTYTLKVGGNTKTEGADYSLDKESGLITMAVAPGDEIPVTLDYKYVHLTDLSWANIIIHVLQDMAGDFWKEIILDQLTSEADAIEVNLSTAEPLALDVVQSWYKNSDDPNIQWRRLSEFSNWRYSKDLNKVFLGRAFSVDGYPLKFHVLKGFEVIVPEDESDLTSVEVDMKDEWLGVLQLGCLWRYYDYRLAERVESSFKVAKERTITPLQNLQAMSQHYLKLYLKEKGRRKPTKPLKVLDNRNQQGGTP